MMETNIFNYQKQNTSAAPEASNDTRYNGIWNYLNDVGNITDKTYNIRRLEIGLKMLQDKGATDERIGNYSFIVQSYKRGIIRNGLELRSQLEHFKRRLSRENETSLEYRVATY